MSAKKLAEKYTEMMKNIGKEKKQRMEELRTVRENNKTYYFIG